MDSAALWKRGRFHRAWTNSGDIRSKRGSWVVESLTTLPTVR